MSKLPEMAELLMRLIGHEPAMRMMEPKEYGGKQYLVPMGDHSRGDASFSKLADVIGADNAMKVCKQFGGSEIYVPMLDQMQRDRRNKQIVADYTRGKKVWDIATEHILSTRQVWSILKNTDAGEEGRQESLF